MTRWKSSDLIAKGKAKKAAVLPASVQRASVLIGIDPGTKTGFAIKSNEDWHNIDTLPIFGAIKRVIAANEYCVREGLSILVRVEDARLRTWFGKKKQKDILGNVVIAETGSERWKGAGSIARDCAIWEEVLTDLKIPFEMVHPKHVKETTADYFKKLTGWQGRTSIHAREAAWLIL